MNSKKQPSRTLSSQDIRHVAGGLSAAPSAGPRSYRLPVPLTIDRYRDFSR